MTAWCRETAGRLGLPELAAIVSVRWNPRLRSTAGRAWPGKALIELNPRLLEMGADEVERTARHELAHLVARARAGRKKIEPHGAEWRQACVELGIPGERATHRLPLPRTRMERRFRYACPGCGTVIGRVRRIRREVACAACCQRHAAGRYDARFRLREVGF